MRVFAVLLSVLSAVGLALAAPPPENQRVLVILDKTNTEVSVDSIVNPLEERGFEVTSAGIKDHPKLYEYGERLVDNVVIVPGKVKALGSTLRAVDILNFMDLGGNVVALSTPKYSPVALREVASQLGIQVSGRGVQYQDNFHKDLIFPHPNILDGSQAGTAQLGEGAAVAKLNEGNPLLSGLAQAPYTAYAWNAVKDTDDEGEVIGAASDVFGAGNESFVAAALQSMKNARFVWLGSAHLLNEQELAKQVTGWAFQEFGKLRLVNATHTDVEGSSHSHYAVEQDLKYCARIEQWIPEASSWMAYSNIEDAQLDFKMLDPYHRLNSGPDGCVEFRTPEQYGMFTFQLEYSRPGSTNIVDKQVVTIRHRANNEWNRSWTISNSWVYLSGVSTTVIAFLAFVVLYLLSGDNDQTMPDAKVSAAHEKSGQKDSGPDSAVSSETKKPKSQKRK